MDPASEAELDKEGFSEEIKDCIRADAAAQKIQRWKQIGFCAMDTACLLIADPCYVIPDSPQDSVELDKRFPDAYPPDDAHHVQLSFKRGHAGAGVTVHSPHGDGEVAIWAKLDALNRVRAVFFSFDGEIPTTNQL